MRGFKLRTFLFFRQRSGRRAEVCTSNFERKINMDIQFKSIRTIDSVGRIVLPSELRELLGIGAYDKLEITVVNGAIQLVKAQ